MQALFGAFLTRSGYIVAEAVPLALGLGRASAYRQGAQFVLVIAGAWVGSHYGIVGAAAGVAVAYWLFYLLCLVLVHQLLHVGALPLIRIHLKGLAIAALPTAVTIGLRLALHPGHALLPNFALAAIFGLLLMLVVGFAPESLVSADIVRVRSHALRIMSSRLRTLARAH
jgi:hypothetical protein